MKVRNGFVSNSSSSSFLIHKAYLTEKQIKQIHEHYLELPTIPDEPYGRSVLDSWDIEEGNMWIHGKTWMDNFDMISYLLEIGVDLKYVHEFSWTNNISDAIRQLRSRA